MSTWPKRLLIAQKAAINRHPPIMSSVHFRSAYEVFSWLKNLNDYHAMRCIKNQ